MPTPSTNTVPVVTAPAGSDLASRASATLRANLRAELLDLPFDAFGECIAMLLRRVGYIDVSPVSGRGHFAGRNIRGGYDLTGFLPAGPHRRPVAVSLKQYDKEPVYQRAVDELRGVCLRTGAAEGLIVTTSVLSGAVHKERAQQSPVVPVRFFDGESLLDLLTLHRLGVQGSDNALTVDWAFFTNLAKQARGNARADLSAKAAAITRKQISDINTGTAGLEDNPRFTVTVTVAPFSRAGGSTKPFSLSRKQNQ